MRLIPLLTRIIINLPFHTERCGGAHTDHRGHPAELHRESETSHFALSRVGQPRHFLSRASLHLELYRCALPAHEDEGKYGVTTVRERIDCLHCTYAHYSSQSPQTSCHSVTPTLYPPSLSQVRVCIGHYASRGLRDPLKGGRESSKLVGIEITDSATIRYRREKVRVFITC